MDAWNQIEVKDYLPSLLEKKTTPNGVFGFKAHFHQYVNTFGDDELPKCAPIVKFIHIKRQNTVRQAVSYCRAIQTNEWASTHEGSGGQPSYDFELILKLKRRVENENNKWEHFFDKHGIRPLRISYETMQSQVWVAVEETFRFLDLPWENRWANLNLTLEKQSDEINDDWVSRFQADLKSAGIQ